MAHGRAISSTAPAFQIEICVSSFSLPRRPSAGREPPHNKRYHRRRDNIASGVKWALNWRILPWWDSDPYAFRFEDVALDHPAAAARYLLTVHFQFKETY
ncbi:hypothetical protein EVAR_65381_1 [Eumeta japonica]|uniref:Uncharacterized protein n=1 Tax=Eumeta variegata TaxID=151549 RepID=A0A4C1ZXZ2_EUMVA|nr:hypothetical protein EVAR_65381_1 [Eumeta japonica]